MGLIAFSDTMRRNTGQGISNALRNAQPEHAVSDGYSVDSTILHEMGREGLAAVDGLHVLDHTFRPVRKGRTSQPFGIRHNVRTGSARATFDSESQAARDGNSQYGIRKNRHDCLQESGTFTTRLEWDAVNLITSENSSESERGYKVGF